MNIEHLNGRLIIQVSKSIYSIDSIYKCFYWYGADYDVTISDINSNTYQIELLSKTEIVDHSQIISKVKRDLIDFKVRDTVTKETQTIRDLIVAKAFAYYDDDTQPRTNVSDPVGFDPNNVLL